MQNPIPFKDAGNTVRFDATGTAANDGDLGNDAEQVTVWNSGSAGCFINFSRTASPTNAILPIVGTSRPGKMIPPGAYVTFSIEGMRYFTTITVTGTCTLYLTPGSGF